ncbi:MAG: acetoin utilization protein AcuC, partial [Janthinobacterium lividum]
MTGPSHEAVAPDVPASPTATSEPSQGRPVFVYSEALTGYDFGSDHAMSPGRVRDTVALARSLGVLDQLDVVPPPPADDALVATVHTPDYIAAVRRCVPDALYGLGTTDNPVFPRMHEVSSQIVTASVEAARQVWEGRTLRASNIAGGLHHAMPGKTSGFCVYNDLAVAIRWLLDHGVERVAYVDVDVHHGDGVQAVFYDDPRVMTVSLHETPLCLFPGTGFPTETGGPNALGSAVNVALPPGTGDAGWLRAFDAIVPQVLAAHRPQVLVTQHGCDAHRHDPLADLDLSLDGQRASYLALAELADELCEGRWVSTGGGGYAVLHVVPRAWTHLLA